MSLSKNVSSLVAPAAPASKKDKLFGLSREDLKIVKGATGVIITGPTDGPLTMIDAIIPATPTFEPLVPLAPLAP
jgi:hypothetical protein